MRPRDTLTVEQERELDAIDRALAGAPVELELHALEALVRDVRATAPQMTPGFAARLEREVGAGFAESHERRTRPSRPRGRRWLLLPAAGSLAAVLAALVVVLNAGDGADRRQVTLAGGEATTGQARPAAGDTAGRAGSGAGASTADRAARPPAVAAAPAPSATTAIAPRPAQRKVQRSAAIALETPADEFDRTTDAVNPLVARFGGIVASAQVGSSDAGGGEATFDLRIPTDRLDRALAALAKLGHVSERTQSLDDITASFTSAQERLTDARAERRGLLRALARATTQTQIDSLRAQLRGVRGRIADLKGQLASLRRRAALATVSLSVRGTGEAGRTGGGGAWTPGDAAGDAVRVLEVLAGVLLVALAIVVPAGLLAGAVAYGVRLGRRRRREAALDPA